MPKKQGAGKPRKGMIDLHLSPKTNQRFPKLVEPRMTNFTPLSSLRIGVASYLHLFLSHFFVNLVRLTIFPVLWIDFLPKIH